MLDVRSWMFDVRRSVLFGSTQNAQRSTSNKEKRVKGIEPSCAAWEAAVLPLNYTRDAISDFRFSIADCNRKCRTAVVCAVLSAGKIGRHRLSAEDSGRYSTQPAKITATKSRRRNS